MLIYEGTKEVPNRQQIKTADKPYVQHSAGERKKKGGALLTATS